MTITVLLTLLLAGGVPAAPAALPAAAPTAVPAVATGSCPSPTAAVAQPGAELPVELAGLGDPIAPADCTAQCGGGSPVSCWGNSCSAQDRNCSTGQQGFVECDGTYTHCTPTCPGSVCTEGEQRTLFGDCCWEYEGTRERTRQKCINGQWVTQWTACAPDLSYCPINP